MKKILSKIEANDIFRIVFNLCGFGTHDMAAHKRFRSIIPSTLAAYGWKVGYVDLFQKESEKIEYGSVKGIRCFAAAHCHHDQTKMELYERRFSRANERFFTDPELALHWIQDIPFPDDISKI